MTTYIRPKLTELEARTIRSALARVMDDDNLYDSVFPNGMDGSVCAKAMSKLTDELIRERKSDANGNGAGKKKTKKK